ncbi:hypothetical protein SteCoe_20309 [Stentor coeruleus]|uniref:Uncharacterized protein n=1 Tax=Stentor coeruleus TaxID=5963 RepID=A0A1R2BS45_9CILI|nr:hypothetical protein SteCoe_20309 [Stentor coeruleus]
MDDESWDFFCNNSPKLVKKQRPKTPINFIGYNKEEAFNKIQLITLSKPRLLQKVDIIKCDVRSSYRDKTSTPVIRKIKSKATIKPIKDVTIRGSKDIVKKRLSPIRISKQSDILIKKVSGRVLKKGL